MYLKFFRYARHRGECTLDIALWVKFKMLAICLRSNLEFISSELKKIRDFYVHLRVFGRHTDIVVRPEGTIDLKCIKHLTSRHYSKVKRKVLPFSTKLKQINVFGVYVSVFSYTQYTTSVFAL